MILAFIGDLNNTREASDSSVVFRGTEYTKTRERFESMLHTCGLVDAFRHLQPGCPAPHCPYPGTYLRRAPVNYHWHLSSAVAMLGVVKYSSYQNGHGQSHKTTARVDYILVLATGLHCLEGLGMAN